jgi:hypothetical protein
MKPVHVHIISRMNGGWSVVRFGKTRASKVCDYKRSAVAYAKRIKGIKTICIHDKETGAIEKLMYC